MIEIDVYRFGVVVAKAKVDEEDAYLGEHRWHRDSDGYTQRMSGHFTKRRCHTLHREIMGNPAGEVDHINGDRLDCQRNNLRITDRFGNNQNQRGAQRNSKTGMRGVRLRSSGRYQVRVVHRGNVYYLGTFTTIEEATSVAEAKREDLGFLRGAEASS